MIASARSASIPVGREFALYVQSDLVSPYISKGGRIRCPSGLKVSPHGAYRRAAENRYVLNNLSYPWGHPVRLSLLNPLQLTAHTSNQFVRLLPDCLIRFICCTSWYSDQLQLR